MIARVALASLIALAVALDSAPALASDGVLEINQACAELVGCFEGDAAGFPVTISNSGSYRLTGNLNVANVDTSAIAVNAADVSIHLSGFTIRGPVVCSESHTNCSPQGNGSGVSGAQSGLTVRDGSIIGMGLYGVEGGDQSEIRNLHLRWNQYGARLGTASSIAETLACENGVGILASQSVLVSNNVSCMNSAAGIVAFDGSIVSNNLVYKNGAGGVSIITGGAMISGNEIYSNTGVGVTANGGSDTVYRENRITGNSSGTISGGVVNRGDNYCSGPGSTSIDCP